MKQTEMPSAGCPYLLAQVRARGTAGAGPTDFLFHGVPPPTVSSVTRMILATQRAIGDSFFTTSLRDRPGEDERWLNERGECWAAGAASPAHVVAGWVRCPAVAPKNRSATVAAVVIGIDGYDARMARPSKARSRVSMRSAVPLTDEERADFERRSGERYRTVMATRLVVTFPDVSVTDQVTTWRPRRSRDAAAVTVRLADRPDRVQLATYRLSM